jgi:RimJ/RimL family protein N-acetyltransferase
MHDIIKEPSECSEKEIEDFFLLVKKGGEVGLHGLVERIERAKYLAFHYEQDELVGIVGLKRPSENYKNKVFRNAGVPKEGKKYSLEIGWAYTDRSYRSKGICTILVQKILEKFESESFYATVRIDNVAMHKVLKKTGFKGIGKLYQGRTNNYIQLFVRTKKAGV